MSNLPRNRWIGIGVAAFAGFVIVVLFSIATVAVSFDPLGQFALKALLLSLPIISFASCGYGLLTIDRSKQSGRGEAVVVLVLLCVLALYILFSL